MIKPQTKKYRVNAGGGLMITPKITPQRQILFKPFLIDAIVHGNRFDAGDGKGGVVYYKTQTRRRHKLGEVGDLLLAQSDDGKKSVVIELTEVRQERLGNISESDCFKEGIVYVGKRTLTMTLPVYHWDKNSKIENCYDMPREAFFDLLMTARGLTKCGDSIDLSEMVWVHDFKVVKNG